MARHMCPPTALGMRMTSLPHKLAAITHSLFLELFSQTKLNQYKSHIISVTTDCGAEKEVGDVPRMGVAGLLPHVRVVDYEEEQGMTIGVAAASADDGFGVTSNRLVAQQSIEARIVVFTTVTVNIPSPPTHVCHVILVRGRRTMIHGSGDLPLRVGVAPRMLQQVAAFYLQ